MRKEMRKLAEGKDKIYEEVLAKHNDMMSKSVPFSGWGRLKPNNTDRMTKWRTDSIYSPKDLNLHDPHEMYRWQDEEANAPAWVWAMRILGTVGFVVGIYALCLLTFLF